MTKRRLIVLLALGICAGLLISACAGVAVGKVEVAMPGQVLTGGPLVEMPSIPFLQSAPQAAQTAHFVYEKAVVQSSLESLTQDQAYMQQNVFCSGAGH
jgi:hypothetical protein